MIIFKVQHFDARVIYEYFVFFIFLDFRIEGMHETCTHTGLLFQLCLALYLV